MKKIILTAAIVCAAVLAQAAAVVWDAGTVTRYDGNAANKNVAGYLFQIAASDYAS